MNKVALAVSTWAGCGYSPVAPGTVGSLAAIATAWILAAHAGFTPVHFAVLAAALIGPGIWAGGVTARDLNKHDPGIVVVDEVVGQWLALAGSNTLTWKSYLSAFALFRLFDIWKPAPARQCERLTGGLGIMADDVVAGIYSAVVIFVAGCFNLY
jgi:phosphatidylglycerophosphatase A